MPLPSDAIPLKNGPGLPDDAVPLETSAPEDLGVAGGRNVIPEQGPRPDVNLQRSAPMLYDILQGVGTGLKRGLVDAPVALVNAARQTPSDLAAMAEKPSIIPGILGQTALNTARMAPTTLGFMAGGPGGGATTAAAQNYLEDLFRGHLQTPGETAANLTEVMAPAKALGGIPGAAPRAEKITPAGAKFSETAQRAGFQPSVSDVAPGQVLSRLEPWAERQLGGGRLTRRAQQEVQTMKGSDITGEPGWLAKEGERVAPSSTATSVARGETIRDQLKQMADENRGLGRDYVWDQVKSFDTGEANLPVERGADVAAEMLRKPEVLESIRRRQTSPALRSEGGTTTSEGAFTTEKMIQGADIGDSLLKSLANHRDVPLTFEQMRVLREEIGRRYNQDPAKWGRLFGAISDDLRNGLQKVPGALETYDRALTYEKQNILPFRSGEPEGFLGRLIDQQEPAKVVDYLLTGKDRAISGLRAIHAQTNGGGPLWESIQGEGIARVLENPRQLSQIGPETRKLLFSPEQETFLTVLDNYRRTSSAAGKTLKDFARPTGVLTALAHQVGQGFTLAVGGLGAAAGAHYGYPLAGMLTGGIITLSPNIIARMLTNPTTAKWLTTGLQTPAGTAEAAHVVKMLLPAYTQAVSAEKKSQSVDMPDLGALLQGGRVKETPTYKLRDILEPNTVTR